MRRGNMGRGKTYRFGPFELRTGAHELFKHGTKVKLRGQPYLILEVLLSRAGSIVSREEIKVKLWPADTFVDFEHGLNTSVKKLRQVLCDSADQPRYVETIPRLGYRFIAPVETLPEQSETSAAPAPEAAAAVSAAAASPSVSLAPLEERPHSVQSYYSRPLWRLLTLSFGVVVILGAFLFGGFAKRRMQWSAGASSGSANASARAKRYDSIAVLPLQNLSTDPEQEYFADGITDELITDLAQFGGLRVISRTSIMQYKDGNKAVPQIARELGVSAVIEGTVERVANRVRIRVQLIDAANDQHLWARGYNREFKDVLMLESTVAHDIAGEVEAQTAERDGHAHASTRTVQPEAFEAYLKGHYFRNQRSEAGLNKSIEFFQEAIAKDPTFAAGYAGLAGSYLLMGSDELPANVARAKAREAATKALQLDPESAEAHAAMGMIAFYYEWNWKNSEHEFQRAIELNPGYVTAHQWYSYYLRAMGRLPEALQEAQKAQQLDPLALPVSTTLAGRYRDLKQFDQATALCQRMLELNANFVPAHEMLAAIYEQQNNFRLAIVEWQKSVELSHENPPTLASLGHAYAVAGRRAEARTIAAKLERISKQHYVAAWDMAVLFAGLGDWDRAFRYLEKSYAERESQVPFLMQDHRLAVLRGDNRFRNLARRVGLSA